MMGFFFFPFPVKDSTLYDCGCGESMRPRASPADEEDAAAAAAAAPSVGNPPSMRLCSSTIRLRSSSSFWRTAWRSSSTVVRRLWRADGESSAARQEGQEKVGRLSEQSGRPHDEHAGVYFDSGCVLATNHRNLGKKSLR